MSTRYIHIGHEAEKRQVLSEMGLVEEDKESETKILPKVCLHCQTVNPCTNDICDVCLFSLEPQRYEEFVNRKRAVEQLLEKGKKVLTPEIEASLRNRVKTISALASIEREDLIEQYLEMLLSGFVKTFLSDKTVE